LYKWGTPVVKIRWLDTFRIKPTVSDQDEPDFAFMPTGDSHTKDAWRKVQLDPEDRIKLWDERTTTLLNIWQDPVSRQQWKKRELR
jgi:hypothetical protein